MDFTPTQHLISVHLAEIEQTTGKPDKSGFLYHDDFGQAEQTMEIKVN